MFSFLTETMINGTALWVVLLICAGVFLASFMDAIAGGGGIISVPVYIMGLGGFSVHYALATNKLSSTIGMCFSTSRFVRHGYVKWRLFLPAAALALAGSVGGMWLQLHTPDTVLKFLLLLVLPVVAFVVLRTHDWPDVPDASDRRRQVLTVLLSALVIGTYDGYYGPGAGTFLMLAFIKLGHMDTRNANGGAKLINLASGIGSLFTALAGGYVLVGVGLCAACASVAGAYIGAGLAIKNGSRIVRPAVIVVLVLLTLKVGSELLFPQFWH